MMKTMMAILMMMAFAASAQAESVLMKLPYGIELGKPLPEKVKRAADEKTETNKNIIIYVLEGKFKVVTEKGEVTMFESSPGQRLSTKWRNLGLRICQGDSPGTSINDVMAIIKREGAKYIKRRTSKEGYYQSVMFEIGGKYSFDAAFALKKFGDCDADSGLWSIVVEGDALNEDY